MLKKIIAGAQTGVERAALELALKLDIPYGGWKAAHLVEPATAPYRLQLLPEADPEQAQRQNIMAADGVLLLGRSPLEPPLKAAAAQAQELGRPCLYIDLAKTGAFQAARAISEWLRANRVEVLYVTGRAAKDGQRTCRDAANILETVYFLNMGASAPDRLAAEHASPSQEHPADDPWQVALGRLLALLSLRQRTHLRRLSAEQVADLRLPLTAGLCGRIVALLRQPPEWPVFTLEMRR